MNNTKMKEYLKDIMTLESEKYRLEKIKKDITKTINQIESEYSKETTFKKDAELQIEKLNKEKEDKINKSIEDIQWIKNKKLLVIVMVVGLFIGVALGVSNNYVLGSIIGVLSFVIPPSIITPKFDKVYKITKDSPECKKDIERIEKEYEEKISSLKNKLDGEIKSKETDYESKKNEMIAFCNENKESIKKLDEEYKEVTDKLDEFYNLNVIFEKYRNLSAITMFYEYFSSSRVFELEGKDGAYNLYEAELRQNLIINNLNKIYENLEDIKDNQYCMYNEMRNVNSSLQTINKNLVDGLNDIAKIEMANLAINSEIAKNVNTIRRIQVHNFIFDK